MPNQSQITVMSGFASALIVFAIIAIRQKRFQGADLASILLAFLAGSNIPTAAYLCLYAFAPDPPDTPTKLQGYEKYIAAAGLCFLFVTLVSVWSLCKKAYIVENQQPADLADPTQKTLPPDQQSMPLKQNSPTTNEGKK
jgi:hypothetical protein